MTYAGNWSAMFGRAETNHLHAPLSAKVIKNLEPHIPLPRKNISDTREIALDDFVENSEAFPDTLRWRSSSRSRVSALQVLAKPVAWLYTCKELAQAQSPANLGRWSVWQPVQPPPTANKEEKEKKGPHRPYFVAARGKGPPSSSTQGRRGSPSCHCPPNEGCLQRFLKQRGKSFKGSPDRRPPESSLRPGQRPWFAP